LGEWFWRTYNAERRTMKYRNIGEERNGWIDDPKQRKLFQRKLLKWYELNRRDLPWRMSRDPYQVWVSEIMLQQTRVAAVIPHYRKFLQRFPTVHKLAAARESSVLAAWSGLGYYRRARMLHTASKKVVTQYSGKLPKRREELSALPGIGRYTSAAIASIAYGEPVAAVDGNVQRIMERLAGRVFGAKEAWQIAGQLVSLENPGDFNQALMDLGATVCIPGRPKCLHCPVTAQCVAHGSLPKITNRIRRKRTVWYALDLRNSSVFLVKRSQEASLMPGMWELPEIIGSDGPCASIFTLRHSITATDYTVRVVAKHATSASSGRWVKNSRARSLPLTGLAKKILRTAKVI
jgi:A/G-specific adenine glycosylase